MATNTVETLVAMTKLSVCKVLQCRWTGGRGRGRGRERGREGEREGEGEKRVRGI